MKTLVLTLLLAATSCFAQQTGGGGGVPGGGSTDVRPSVIATTGKGAGGTGTPLPAGGSVQVFSATGAGTITYLHLTIGQSGADALNLIENSTLDIDCDGNPQIVPMGAFFLSQDYPAPFNTDFLSIPANTSSNATFNRRTAINFYSSCTITLNNASASATANVFFDTAYRSGTPVVHNYWNAYVSPLQSLVANTNAYNYPQIYALPRTTFSGGGQLEYVQEYFNSSANYQYLESTPVVTADSNVAAVANGHEDFYSSGYYCNASYGTALSATDNKWGCLIGSGLQDKAGTYDFVGYRWFTTNSADNLLFNGTLSVSSANGGNNYGSPGTVNWSALVSYFTNTPTVAQIGIAPPSGTYSGTQSVTLTGGPSGDVICYTGDGTTPVPNGSGGCSTGAVYSSPVSVSTTSKVSAVGALSGYNSSPVTSVNYVITGPYDSPTYRSNCGNTESSSPSTVVSCTLSPTAGDFLFVMCRGGISASTTYAATSSPAGTFTPMSAIFNSNGSNQASYAFGATGGSTTVTCTASNSTSYQGITVLDYAPGSITTLAAGSPNTIDSATTTFTSAAATTTGAAFFIVCGDPQYGPPVPTVGTINGSAATGRTMSNTYPSYCEDLSVESSVSGATGSLTANSAGNWDGVIAAFR